MALIEIDALPNLKMVDLSMGNCDKLPECISMVYVDWFKGNLQENPISNGKIDDFL